MSPVETVARKEWAETLRNGTIMLTFALLAVIFFGMPLGVAFAPSRYRG